MQNVASNHHISSTRSNNKSIKFESHLKNLKGLQVNILYISKFFFFDFFLIKIRIRHKSTLCKTRWGISNFCYNTVFYNTFLYNFFYTGFFYNGLFLKRLFYNDFFYTAFFYNGLFLKSFFYNDFFMMTFLYT